MPSRAGTKPTSAIGTNCAAAALALFACVRQAEAHHALLPLPPRALIRSTEPPFHAPHASRSGTWTNLKHKFPGPTGPDTALLMTDGTVLMHSWCSATWFRLTPDKKGSYITGSWSQAANLPAGYYPLYFASAVLPDGRMIVEGGEYNGTEGNCNAGNDFLTTKGALYDNVSNTWTEVAPPDGWIEIGDAQSVVLPDGRYMLASCCRPGEAIASIDGTKVTWKSTGRKKKDSNSEEGWTLLPDGTVLTVDTHLGGSTSPTEIYDPATGKWTVGADTTAILSNEDGEIGPGVLRPDGTLIWLGAVPNDSLYDFASKTWSSVPSFPLDGYDVADGPAATLPNGNVLVEASPGEFNPPAHFFEFDGENFSQVDDTDDAPNDTSFEGRFLLLPTGQVLYSNAGLINGSPFVAVYTPKGRPQADWRPKIVTVSDTLARGSSNNPIKGRNFNGFSQGAYYGDDAQESTNYPIVMIVNDASGDVCFGRSHDFSTMGVANAQKMTAEFDVPQSCEPGASKFMVSVNGIASRAVPVTLQ